MTARVTRLLDLLDTDGRRLHVLLTRLTLCESTAEDLLQELFLRLSKSKSFDAARNHTAYAFRAATNLAFEWRRKQSRTVQPESLATDPIAKTRSAQESLELGESCREVLRALDKMSELSRQVIVMHRLQGESYDSIALQLNKTPHQVRAICSKAIGQLRDLLVARSSVTEGESK